MLKQSSFSMPLGSTSQSVKVMPSDCPFYRENLVRLISSSSNNLFGMVVMNGLFGFRLSLVIELIYHDTFEPIAMPPTMAKTHDPPAEHGSRTNLERMVDEINTNQTHWKASLPRVEPFVCAHFDDFDGATTLPPPPRMTPSQIPKDFDSRIKWGSCITPPSDQSTCNSCYALASIAVIQDRFCIKYNQSLSLSALDVIACCGLCPHEEKRGCAGGKPLKVFAFYNTFGIVTERCQPYPFAKCDHRPPASAFIPDLSANYSIPNATTYPKCGREELAPPCVHQCIEKGMHYHNEKKHGSDGFVLKDATITTIKEEIFTRGPLLARLRLYQDFSLYEKGIYKHVTGAFRGYHAVRLLGWGKTKDKRKVDFWIACNTYNEEWGEKGYFRIEMGDSGIEERIIANNP